MNQTTLLKAKEINEKIENRESFLEKIKLSLSGCMNIKVEVSLTRGYRRPVALFLPFGEIKDSVERMVPKIEAEIITLKKELEEL